jgi:DNA-directed RNA polymerase specialized sigma24 family protein
MHNWEGMPLEDRRHDDDAAESPDSGPRVDLDARFAGIDLADVMLRFMPYALGRTGSKERAREAVQAAIAACMDPSRSLWDPQRNPNFYAYFFGVLKGSISNTFETDQARRRYERKAGKAIAMVRGDTAPSPEDARAEGERRDAVESRNERRVDDARRELAGDAEALSLLDAMLHCEKPADQADHLGWTAPDVYRVKKRVLRAVERVRDRERDAGRGADDAATDDDYDEEKP